MTVPRHRNTIEDWVILKYGWLFVFLVHMVFLLAGVREIREALEFFTPEILEPAQRRLDHVIQAIYMWTIAFSIILLIVAVFVLEIFRSQHKILKALRDLERGSGAAGSEGPDDAGTDPVASGEGEGAGAGAPADPPSPLPLP